MVVSSGTETALNTNYRTATSAYYAALAGIEEARGRLSQKNSDPIPLASIPTAPGSVLYITHPAGGEVVNPQDTATSTTYPDLEYKHEFGGNPPGNPAPIASVADNNGQNVPGALFKWVRINPVSESSLNVDIDGGGIDPDPTHLLYYNPMHQDTGGNRQASLTTSSMWPAMQVFEITSLAVLPNGSQKMLQYLVAPVPYNPNSPGSPPSPFFGALTLDGSSVSFTGPSAAPFQISGNDSCPIATPAPTIHAIDYPQAAGSTGISTAEPSPSHYIPDLAPFTMPSLQMPSQVESLAAAVASFADVTFPGNATASSMPTNLTNPLTIVVNGDLDLSSWHNTGSGILLVRGKLTYDPDASWFGIVLVIGKGELVGGHSGSGGLHGAVFVAASRDPVSGNVLPDPNLGPACVDYSGGANPCGLASGVPAGNPSGFGIQYDSCPVTSPPKVLSFREIPNPTN